MAWFEESQKFLKASGTWTGKWEGDLRRQVNAASIQAGQGRGLDRSGVMLNASGGLLENLAIANVGNQMETTANLLNTVNKEVEESKQILEKLSNEVNALATIVGPALMNQAKELRSSRMAVVNEVRESLSAMSDVRKFFLDSNYEVEMARLERFVKVCRELQELKNLGVIDAVCDSAIKLALKGG